MKLSLSFRCGRCGKICEKIYTDSSHIISDIEDMVFWKDGKMVCKKCGDDFDSIRTKANAYSHELYADWRKGSFLDISQF